jgi:hypothetical protein
VAKVLWAFGADQFILDRGGKFSIIGIWEIIYAVSFPALHPQLFVVAGWQGAPSVALTYEIRVWTPGNTLVTTSGVTPFQLGPNGKGISIAQFAGLQLVQPGVYRVEIMQNGVTAHTLELTAAVPQVPSA